MLRFHVVNKREQQHFEHLGGPIEFGRGPQRNGVPRCVIQDSYISRDHANVTELSAGLVRVENLSQRNSIRLSDNSLIATGASRDLPTPLRLTVGETCIDVETVEEEKTESPLETIASPPTLNRRAAVGLPQHSLLDLGKTPTPETLTHWFETVIAVQRAAAGSPEFFEQTARAVVSLVGLDRGLVILKRGGRWTVQARCPEDGDTPGREFSLSVVERVLRERRTFYQSQAQAQNTSESLQGVEAVVASPIFDARDEVVGAVYGCRSRFTAHQGLGIGPLEAQVMQLLASAVGVGLARQDQEAEAGRLRVQFEQFFSADLARELQRNPRLLDGQEREVTVLFSDIRGFSRLSEKLGATETCKLVSDVMDHLTTNVRDQDGVVVDYAGDGLMAMWNAPANQPDHAAKACRAALAMIAGLPELDARWNERLGVPLRLGVGLNTGPALCGNTGSKQKFKYGPLGHTVNLASRVEGATKHFGVPLLITGTTRAALGDGFALRRLCKVHVVGIAGAVDLFELAGDAVPAEWREKSQTYEAALALYEAANFLGACRGLSSLLADEKWQQDVPCLNLLARSVQGMKAPPENHDGVIDLESK
jgi:adenylate cyclase